QRIDRRHARRGWRPQRDRRGPADDPLLLPPPRLRVRPGDRAPRPPLRLRAVGAIPGYFRSLTLVVLEAPGPPGGVEATLTWSFSLPRSASFSLPALLSRSVRFSVWRLVVVRFSMSVFNGDRLFAA